MFKSRLNMHSSSNLDISVITNNTNPNLDLTGLSHINSPKNKYLGSTIRLKNFIDLKFGNICQDTKIIAKNLTKDLIDFHEYNRKQIEKNKPLVDIILNNIIQIIKSCSYDFDVMVFGSYQTNLCLAWSDIDLVVNSKLSVVNSLNILGNLKQKFDQNTKIIKNIVFVESTTIPLLKLVTQDHLLNYHIDISVQDGKHFGIECVKLVKLFLETYDVLEPIIIGLKNILKCAGLNDPYKGGLSSYGLILLVVYHLQILEEEYKINTNDKNNLGRIFIEFLFYYGAKFDHNRTIVEVFIPGKDKVKFYQVRIKFFLLLLLFIFKI